MARHYHKPFQAGVVACLLLLGCRVAHAAAPEGLKILKTPGGVRFGMVGGKQGEPAPTLVVLALSIEQTLGDPAYLKAGVPLAKQGFVLVSVDLPCHGEWIKADEPKELKGWADRLKRGEPIVDELNRRLAEVLTYLIASKYSDPARIAVCGTSRGGFAALHFAAYDRRVKCVAAYSPVTELGVLTEFHGIEASPAARDLDLAGKAAALVGRPVWVIIGDQDERVSTDKAIAFARAVSRAKLVMKFTSRIELHVMPSIGHRTPEGHEAMSASWIAAQMREGR